LLLAFVAGPALALPAPMSDDELLAKSDLVALIRVLSVTCTGVDKDERTGEALPSYKAHAEQRRRGKRRRRQHHLPRRPDRPSWALDRLLLPWRDGVYPSGSRRRCLYHDLVERPRGAGQQAHHHRAAD